MGFKKAELRKHARLSLPIRPNNGLLCAEQIKYIVHSALKNICGRRVLVLYIYSREKLCDGHFLPVYTLFQTKEDFITLSFVDDERGKWRTAQVNEILQGANQNLNDHGAFFAQNDMVRVTKYIGHEALEGFPAVFELQWEISRQRARKRAIEREKRVVARMDTLPALPRGFRSWIVQELVPRYVLYQYVRGNKPMKAYCTGCQKEFVVTGVRHNSQGQCPSCKRQVTFKASGRAGLMVDRKTAQVVQRCGEREFVIRIYKMQSVISTSEASRLNIWESARSFVEWNDTNSLTETPYYYAGGGITTPWRKGERPRFSYWQYCFEADTCGYLYPKGIEETFDGTPWEYCPFTELASVGKQPFELDGFLYGYTKYPVIEYLVKFGLYNLAFRVAYGNFDKTVMNPAGKKIRDVLHVGPEDLPLLRQVNASEDQLELLQCLRAAGKPCSEELLCWSDALRSYSPKTVAGFSQHMSMERMMRYIDGQYASLKGKVVNWSRRYTEKKEVVVEYYDYLRMCQRMEYNMNSKFVLFPRNLMEAHDRAAKVYADKKTQVYSADIEKMYYALRKKYAYVNFNMAIVPPRTSDEIIREGHALHHCVGVYIERIAEGQCTILFLRKLEAISTSFFTVEIRDGKVTQVRGMKNRSATPEVKAFIKAWERMKLQPQPEALPVAA